jgi:hypothetical protein
MENVNEECVLCGETVVIPANEVDQYSVLCDECHSANVSHGVVTENAVSVPKRSYTHFPFINIFPFF